MTKEQADTYLKQYVKDKTGHSMKRHEVADFELDGEETLEIIEGYADDYISDLDSEEAEYMAHQQDVYDERNEYAIRQSEMIERFRNEY